MAFIKKENFQVFERSTDGEKGNGKKDNETKNLTMNNEKSVAQYRYTIVK